MRSPIKRRPLRNPGDSLDNEFQEIVWSQFAVYYFAAAFFVLLAETEWVRWFTKSTPNPILYSLVAMCTVAVAGYKIRSAFTNVRNPELVRDGEKAVGRLIERSRDRGAQVIHEFPDEKFNIDHVVVHQSGVYAIETKTASKPDRGEPKIPFDGQAVQYPGRTLDRDPVKQARALAKWLQELILETSEKRVPVRPVVVFPGWFIVPTGEAKRTEVWDLNPKALPTFIEHSEPQIPVSDVHLITSLLTRHVRNVLA